ncbi:S1 family peptidase [Edaphobacter flagellatus]|uniref:S1 family peptidase n=1 Tax=Edaphobacter flagellatus TaxID=1933044 RepID=UPI0021B227FA|nr:serine protease [Edaphobacter flagellatus]
MTLTDLYYQATPCVVGFIARFKVLPANSPPLFPDILGTGFLVDDCGTVVTNRHVVDVFDQIPQHPERKESPVAAVIFFFSEDRLACQMAAIEPKGSCALGSFSTEGDWYGQTVPDIGFVQLKVKGTPFLPLASADSYLEVGMEIATIGYPLGTAPLTALGKLNQVSPFIRRGIVSSVLPFPTRRPHGFSIDIMQQGGSSGSPILSTSNAEVVGMMYGGVIETRTAQSASASLSYTLNTNISLAEPSHVIQQALAEYKREYPQDVSAFPTLAELRSAHPKPSMTQDLTWEVWPK